MVLIKSEMQILSHSFLNFFFGSGIGEVGGISSVRAHGLVCSGSVVEALD